MTAGKRRGRRKKRKRRKRRQKEKKQQHKERTIYPVELNYTLWQSKLATANPLFIDRFSIYIDLNLSPERVDMGRH